MRIGYWAGTLSYRGTHVAIFDYALHNQQLLGHESVILIDAQLPGPSDLLHKFELEFECVKCDGLAGAAQMGELRQCDAVYIIKSGERDKQVIDGLPNLVHAVFPQRVQERHGDVYAFVSEWLSRECSNRRLPFVPHMISLPDTTEGLRHELGIPATATVFGCYGGRDSFDLRFVQTQIASLVNELRHVWFIFMNVAPFISHERVLFLPGSSDMRRKTLFINTCDAMVHARGMGESFGIACGEFSIRNKPVITYGLSPQRSHLDILGSRGLVYRGPKEFAHIIRTFDRGWSVQQSWDCYSEHFSPEPVMQQFSKVFVGGLGQSANARAVELTLHDRIMVAAHNTARRLRGHSRKYHHQFS